MYIFWKNAPMENVPFSF